MVGVFLSSQSLNLSLSYFVGCRNSRRILAEGLCRLGMVGSTAFVFSRSRRHCQQIRSGTKSHITSRRSDHEVRRLVDISFVVDLRVAILPFYA